MKRFLIIAALFVSTVGVATAAIINHYEDDKQISFAELPAKAQQFIQTHYPNSEVTFATMDRDIYSTDYDVRLSCGTKIEFDGDGEWTEVDCHRQAVAKAIVPEQIESYVANNYPSQAVCEIQRGHRGWDVKLTSGLELEFDSSFRLMDIDD